MLQKIKQFIKKFHPKLSIIDYVEIVEKLGPNAYTTEIQNSSIVQFGKHLTFDQTKEQLEIAEANDLVHWMEVEGRRLYYLTHYGTTTLQRFRK